MREFGLIGYPLSHSFSKKYFTQKFNVEGIQDASYDIYPIETIDQLPELIKNKPGLSGLNVTIPYKEQIIPFLDELDPKSKEIGAVNTIKIIDGRLIGYNTDYYGFKDSLTNFIGANLIPTHALVLGTGGASKAVVEVLRDLDIPFQLVSRNSKSENLSYDRLPNLQTVESSNLIINTTPLGMSPNTDSLPELPYDQITENHFLFDLVYNPLVTAFMRKGIEKKCWVKNGLEMLHLQAEKSWEIWNS